MNIPLYVVDAFTPVVFRGNPAAVCPLDEWLDDATLQAIAAENNLAETAFLVRQDHGWHLRWFTPAVEVELCGHATLASALVLALSEPDRTEFRFRTLSGELVVTREDDWFTLDFPARTLTPLAPDPGVAAALGIAVLSLTQAARTVIAEVADAAQVRACRPDIKAIAALPWNAVIVTAPGEDCDFVSRFFAPRVGIDEDPVTGSAHCGLVPWWAGKLGRRTLRARQLSARGGELRCELRGERVLMSGQGVLYSRGAICL